MPSRLGTRLACGGGCCAHARHWQRHAHGGRAALGARDLEGAAHARRAVTQPGQAAPQTVGQIQLARFLSPTGLQAIGENLFRETTSSGPPQVGIPSQQGNGQLIQGALESSNVNVVEEMVSMIETQRAYEVNSKTISASDEMMRFLSNNL